MAGSVQSIAGKFKSLVNKVRHGYRPVDQVSKSLLAEYTAIKKSRLFDSVWYLRTYPEVADTGIDPLLHYCQFGWKEGRNPNPDFDGDAYLSRYRDVRHAAVNPLLHWVTCGKNEGLKASSLSIEDYLTVDNEKLMRMMFCKEWYADEHPDLAASGIDLFRHYMEVGWKANFDPAPTFSSRGYLDRYEDVLSSGVNPLLHFAVRGRFEKRSIPRQFTHIPFLYLPARNGPFAQAKGEDPLISVIVASYNYENYIIETLEGLAAQTYGNYEVIIVDDGSKDASVEAISKFVEGRERFRLYQHPDGANKGLAQTIKLALENSRGEYVAFCESDDLWEPNHLKRKVQMIRKYGRPDVISNDVATFGDYKRCCHLEMIVGKIRLGLRTSIVHLQYADFMKANWIPTFSCCMIRRDRLLRCNLLDNPRPSATDWWVYRQLAAQGSVFCYIPEKLTRWRVHQSYNTTQYYDYRLLQDSFNRATNAICKIDYPAIPSVVREREMIDAVRKSPLFDEGWYRNEYSIRPEFDAARHYFYVGWRERFNPSMKFDTSLYCDWNPDVEKAGICPLYHFVKEPQGKISAKVAKVGEDGVDVFLVTSVPKTDGVYLWRVKFMAERLRRMGLNVMTASLADFRGRDLFALGAAKTVVFNRPRNSGASLKLMSIVARRGKRLVIDIDDLVMEEGAVNSGLYQSGLIPYDRLVSNMHTVSDCYHFADAVTVSTPRIALRMKERFGISCGVVPNAIPKRYCKGKPFDTTRGFRLLYASGTKTHNKDFSGIYADIFSFMLRHNDATLTVLGQSVDASNFSAFGARVCFVPYTDFESMLNIYAAHDLLVVPLAHNDFNDAKSNIKYIEAGAVGTPVLASDCAEFRTAITDGVTGFLYHDDFAEKLEAVYRKRGALFDVGRAALEDVRKNHTGEKALPITTKEFYVS